MIPILFSIGSIHISTLSISIIISWVVWSFLFWRSMRSQGIDETNTFDIMFYSTITALFGSRLFYVVFHASEFADTYLKIVAFWIVPGLSLYGGLIVGGLTIFILSKRVSIRFAAISDIIAFSLLPSLVIGYAGGFLSGSLPYKQYTYSFFILSKIVHVSINMSFVLFFSTLLLVLVLRMYSKVHQHWSPGQRSIVSGFWFGLLLFCIEFTSLASKIFNVFTIGQLLALSLMSESLGMWYVKGGKKYIHHGLSYIKNLKKFRYTKHKK
jgi:prolipoprotein diacylglyceryltransferase